MKNLPKNQPKKPVNLLAVVLISILLSAGVFGFIGYYLGIGYSRNNVTENSGVASVIPTTGLVPDPESTPDTKKDWIVYTDPKNRFSFKYPSSLVFSEFEDTGKKDFDTYFLETPNYRPEKEGSYHIQITLIPNKLGVPKVLPVIESNTPEESFTNTRTFVKINGKVGIETTYRESWKDIYKKYTLYSEKWEVSVNGTGQDMSILDQVVSTFNLK